MLAQPKAQCHWELLRNAVWQIAIGHCVRAEAQPNSWSKICAYIPAAGRLVDVSVMAVGQRIYVAAVAFRVGRSLSRGPGFFPLWRSVRSCSLFNIQLVMWLCPRSDQWPLTFSRGLAHAPDQPSGPYRSRMGLPLRAWVRLPLDPPLRTWVCSPLLQRVRTCAARHHHWEFTEYC